MDRRHRHGRHPECPSRHVLRTRRDQSTDGHRWQGSDHHRRWRHNARHFGAGHAHPTDRSAKGPGASEEGRRKTEVAKRSAFARRLRRTPWPSAVPLRRARLGLPVRTHFRPGSGRPRVGTRPGGGPRSDFSRVRTSTGPLDTGALVRLPLERPVRRSLRLTVARSHGDLELNDLIPLLVASIALGDGKKFSEPATRILGR